MTFIRKFIAGALATVLTAMAVRSEVVIEGTFDTKPANNFGAKVFDQLLAAGAGSTLVVSPFSLGSALDMLTLGAEGETAKLLRSRRGQPESSSLAIDNQVKLQRVMAVASTDDVIVSTANSIWLKPNAAPRPAFMAAMLGVYNAEVTNIDFSMPSAAGKVNAWVKENTRDLIPEIVDRLDARTEFLLINTVYFKGRWAVPFDKEETKPAAFTRADGTQRDVPMMNASVILDYAEDAFWHAVRIPYRGERFAMVVMTAKDPAKINEARREFGARKYAVAATSFEPHQVTLALPRFRVEYGADLKDALGQLGLAGALAARANYRQISAIPVKVSSVIHRAVVEVNEDGTEAAAATGVVATRSMEGPVMFSADRPFVFAITDKLTGTVLFLGYVADPVP